MYMALEVTFVEIWKIANHVGVRNLDYSEIYIPFMKKYPLGNIEQQGNGLTKRSFDG